MILDCMWPYRVVNDEMLLAVDGTGGLVSGPLVPPNLPWSLMGKKAFYRITNGAMGEKMGWFWLYCGHFERSMMPHHAVDSTGRFGRGSLATAKAKAAIVIDRKRRGSTEESVEPWVGGWDSFSLCCDHLDWSMVRRCAVDVTS